LFLSEIIIRTMVRSIGLTEVPRTPCGLPKIFTLMVAMCI